MNGRHINNLFLVNDYVAIDKNIIKQEELSWLWLLSAHLDQNTLSNKNPASCLQWLSTYVHSRFIITLVCII